MCSDTLTRHILGHGGARQGYSLGLSDDSRSSMSRYYIHARTAAYKVPLNLQPGGATESFQVPLKYNGSTFRTKNSACYFVFPLHPMSQGACSLFPSRYFNLPLQEEQRVENGHYCAIPPRLRLVSHKEIRSTLCERYLA